MENKLDKLFRDKLEQHSIAPSANAWEKVAASFPKKNNTWALSWRIAAAVAILALVGWFAFDFGKEEKTEITNDNSNVLQKIEPPKQEVTTSNKPEEKVKVVEDKTPVSVNRTVAQSTTPKKESEQKSVIEKIENIQPEQIIASVEEVVVQPAVVQETVKPTPAKKGMVIVYNLTPVDDRQEVEPAKTNRLKKVLEFAKDVKSGDATTFASVRNWKDNLLGSEELTRVEKQNNE